MKKMSFIALVAVAAAVAVSCASQDEKEAKFKATLESIENELDAAINKIQADSALSDEGKAAAVDSVYDVLSAKYMEENRKAYSKNKDNKIGLMAVMNLRGEVSSEEFVKMVDGLAEEVKTSDEAQRIVTAAKALSTTLEGMPFVDFTVEDSDGKTVSFSDYVGKGQYVLVDFWASWCGPCRREIPNVADIYKEYGPKGLRVLSVAVWDKPDDSKQMAEKLGIDWDQIINAQAIPTDAYGIMGIPQIMLFGPDGTILKRDLRGEGIEEELKKYL